MEGASELMRVESLQDVCSLMVYSFQGVHDQKGVYVCVPDFCTFE